MVKPMTARSGYVTYIEYVAGSNKGGVKQGDVFNNPFEIGEMGESRVNYTGATVVETVAVDGEVKWGKAGTIGCFDEENKFQEGMVKKADGSIVALADVVVGDEVSYIYDNIVIPQADLPIINARTKDIPLVAKARRIAVYYSQMAAYELKMEMGEDLGQNLSEQAIGELKYEIDTEVIMFLRKLAGEALPELKFNKALPIGVSLDQHYAAFAEVLEKAKMVVYNRTRRYLPNYMVCASDVLPVLSFCPTFKQANIKNVNGPFVAGNLGGLKVVVSPALKDGEFFFGVNEGMISAAVYAPYMAVVPTQLLGYADGAMSQGFSTMYALAELNANLLAAGKVVTEKQVSYWSEA